jgi:hypothetical protein
MFLCCEVRISLPRCEISERRKIPVFAKAVSDAQRPHTLHVGELKHAIMPFLEHADGKLLEQGQRRKRARIGELGKAIERKAAARRQRLQDRTIEPTWPEEPHRDVCAVRAAKSIDQPEQSRIALHLIELDDQLVGVTRGNKSLNLLRLGIVKAHARFLGIDDLQRHIARGRPRRITR